MYNSSASAQFEGVDTVRQNGGKFPGIGNVDLPTDTPSSLANINPSANPSSGSFQSLVNSQY
jgi:hypothetical protein